MGEPGGIGPDISILAWKWAVQSGGPAFGLLADLPVIAARARQLEIELPLQEADFGDISNVFSRALPVIPLRSRVEGTTGKSAPANSAAVIEAIERAVGAIQAGGA